MSTLLTAVEHVCFLFSHTCRVGGQLAGNLIRCLLEVGFSVHGRLNGRWDVCFIGSAIRLGSTFVDGGDMLSFR